MNVDETQRLYIIFYISFQRTDVKNCIEIFWEFSSTRENILHRWKI